LTQHLILARHGNTFGPQDKPVWVGARSDFPLVEKGIAQANALADALANTHTALDAMIAGPLKRTQETARIVAERLSLPPETIITDLRLREIDYGSWEGLSTEDIIAGNGGAELSAWNKQSIYPTSPGWRPSEAQIIVDTAAIMADAVRGTSLIVTSNGILRFFARVAVNANDIPERKVATGHICVMERHDQGDWHILQWNQPPHMINLGAN
jgi:probable phosphoglycerate mutase